MARMHELPGSPNAVETAIARVLAAESAAREAMAQAMEAAAARDEATRGAIRSLSQRTQVRIAAIRARFARTIASEVAALEAERERIAQPVPLTSDELAALDDALAALAAELTGTHARTVA